MTLTLTLTLTPTLILTPTQATHSLPAAGMVFIFQRRTFCWEGTITALFNCMATNRPLKQATCHCCLGWSWAQCSSLATRSICYFNSVCLITVHHGRVPCGDSFRDLGPSFASPRASRWRSRRATGGGRSVRARASSSVSYATRSTRASPWPSAAPSNKLLGLTQAERQQ